MVDDRNVYGATYRVLVRQGELADLSELLGRGVALVAGLESVAASIPVVDRPGFLVARPQNDPQPIIERLAGAECLTFVLGAGVSMEAGLPSWAGLVRSLLESAAPASLDENDRAAWLDAAAESGLLGMAATARVLAGSDEEFVKRVDEHLYRGKGPDYFDPGPLAREIAAWKQSCPEIQLATFNYDQLLERALQDVGLAAQPREDNVPEPGGVSYVRHLHGLLTGTPANDAVVLTERDYAVWSPGSWQGLLHERGADRCLRVPGLVVYRPEPVALDLRCHWQPTRRRSHASEFAAALGTGAPRARVREPRATGKRPRDCLLGGLLR
ncbi:MAG: SIR2 family protein [Solirubrobacteraceae bacterium]